MEKNDGVVRNLTFPSLKGCGIPAGITIDGIIEFEIDLELDKNIYDVIVLKTEEEVLSMPLSIKVREEAEDTISTQPPAEMTSEVETLK